MWDKWQQFLKSPKAVILVVAAILALVANLMGHRDAAEDIERAGGQAADAIEQTQGVTDAE